MDDESVSFISGNTFSKLLKRRFGSRMSGVRLSGGFAAVDFHDQEHIDQLECCRHDDKEVAGDHGFGVVAYERHPALGWVHRTFGRLGHVTTNRPRGNLNANFHQQFVAIRSSPHVGLLVAISTINARTSEATPGRPRGRDFHFQKRRKPLRCQRINVSGLTIVRAFRQSKKRESPTSVKRMGAVARRGFVCRSTYSPSCLRRNRFSAATEAGERRRRRKNVSRSANTARTLRTNVKRAERLDGGAAIR